MNTTEIKVDAVAAEHPAVRVVVERAAEWMAEVVADSPKPVHVEWSGFYDSKAKQPVVTVRLSTPDVDVHAAGIFTLAELVDRERAEPRFLQLFSQFLRYHVKRLVKLVATPD